MHAQNFGQNIMFLFYCSQCLRDAYLMINQYFSVRRRDISIIQSLQLFVIKKKSWPCPIKLLALLLISFDFKNRVERKPHKVHLVLLAHYNAHT